MSHRRVSEVAIQIQGEVVYDAATGTNNPRSRRGSSTASTSEALAARGFVTGPSTPQGIRPSSAIQTDAQAQAQATSDIREMEAARAQGQEAMKELHERRKRAVEEALGALQAVEIEMGGGVAEGQAKTPSPVATKIKVRRGSGSALARAKALRQALRTLGVDRNATSAEVDAALAAQLRAASSEAEAAAARHAYSQISYRRASVAKPPTTNGALREPSQPQAAAPAAVVFEDMRV